MNHQPSNDRSNQNAHSHSITYPPGTGPRVRKVGGLHGSCLYGFCLHGFCLIVCSVIAATIFIGCQAPRQTAKAPPLPPMPPGWTPKKVVKAIEAPKPKIAEAVALSLIAEPVGFVREAGAVRTNQFGYREWWFTNAENWTAWIFQKTDDGTNWTYFLEHDEVTNQWLSKRFIVSEPQPSGTNRNYRLIRWK